MRSEQEMLDLIVNTALFDERIRIVIMNGSRVNPNVPRDVLQDFDILYGVTDVSPFRNNLEWIKQFGDVMIMQMPENMLDPSPDNDGSFVYLMQFTDGSRIDLKISPLTKLDEICRDSLSRLLLDKDGIIEPFGLPNESDYLPKPPTEKEFSDCCNEFWWVSTYVAKGLWREEIIYAKFMLDEIVREQLMKMLSWHIGLKTSFLSNPGYHGKYFQKYLEADLWNLLEKTYTSADYVKTWEALTEMCSLFRRVAVPIAEHFNFDYPFDDDKNVSAHLEYMRLLPKNATDLY